MLFGNFITFLLVLNLGQSALNSFGLCFKPMGLLLNVLTSDSSLFSKKMEEIILKYIHQETNASIPIERDRVYEGKT